MSGRTGTPEKFSVVGLLPRNRITPTLMRLNR
nr:MAG TPA: hypothetical protein [Caudoviricetes sp.]